MKFEKDASIKDEIQLGDKTIHFEYTPSMIAPEYFKLLGQLTEAEKKIKEDPHTYSNLVARMMVLIFGGENAKEITEFYGSDAQGLIDNVIYFMAVRIAPAIRYYSKAKIKRIKEQHREMRKQSWRAWFHR